MIAASICCFKGSLLPPPCAEYGTTHDRATAVAAGVDRVLMMQLELLLLPVIVLLAILHLLLLLLLLLRLNSAVAAGVTVVY